MKDEVTNQALAIQKGAAMIGRADYAERKERRIKRMRDRADKARRESVTRERSASSLAGMIPMGQPILVGHHSEKRHRRDIDRIQGGFQKAFELDRLADDLDRRANLAESNHAISSDDPEALQKLRAELKQEELSREEGKRLNALHKKGGWEAVIASVGQQEGERLKKSAGFSWDKRPCASYSLTNASARIRRIKQRIAALEAAAARPKKDPENFGDIQVHEENNRIQIVFPGKPSAEVRTKLKRGGFRWAPSIGAWQRMPSTSAWEIARNIAKENA